MESVCPHLLPLLSQVPLKLESTHLDLLDLHFELMLKWNQKISLTSITSPKEAALLHYFESLFAASLIPEGISSLADLGSGAGLPGIPIAIALSHIQVTLVDSDSRKAAFLGECRRKLQLTNLSIINSRLQELTTPFQAYSCRALEQFTRILPDLSQATTSSSLVMLFVSLQDGNKLLSSQYFQGYTGSIHPVPFSRDRSIVILRRST